MKKLFLILSLVKFLDAHASKTDTIYQRAIFVDLVSSYYTFFDTRNQFRFNVGTEINLGKKKFAMVSIDAGIFDQYKFSKYYDFFNQNQGFYTIKKEVLVKGFHMQPSYNYILFQSNKYMFQRVFIGALLDVSYYRKIMHTLNSQNLDYSIEKYNQFRTNLGICAGIEYPIYKRIHVAVQTTMTRKIATLISNNYVPIKPLNGHWVDISNMYSWFTNIKICYGL